MLNVSLNAIGTLIQFSMMICKTLESLMLLFLTFYLYSQGTGAVNSLLRHVCYWHNEDPSSVISDSSSTEQASAGLGITKQLRDAMVATDGTPEEEANAKFWLIDKHGLIRQSTPDVREDLRAFIRSDEEWTSLYRRSRTPGYSQASKADGADWVLDSCGCFHRRGRENDGGALRETDHPASVEPEPIG